MKMISSSTTYLPFLSRAVGCVPSAVAQCIMCIDDSGKPLAGVLYDGYNGASISAHIWIDAESSPSREWFCCIFDYPFNRLQVKKIIGQVRSTNDEAMKLDEHFGFSLEAVIEDYFEDGDLKVYTMRREQCRVLNSRLWNKIRNIVERV